MMRINFFILITSIIITFPIDGANIPIAGNFDPFADDNLLKQNDENSTDEVNAILNHPSLDSIHNEIHHDTELKTDANIENFGPSLNLIDSHEHNDEDSKNNSLNINSDKRHLMQPSIDFLDEQLHGGFAHQNQNDAEESAAADLNDFQRWLIEQNKTDQLNRFLLLQKEMNQYNLEDTKELKTKLNRTIEEMKLSIQDRQRTKHEL